MTAPNPNLPRTPNYPSKQTTHLQIFPGAPNVIKIGSSDTKLHQIWTTTNAAKFINSPHLSILHRCRLSTQPRRKASTEPRKQSETKLRIVKPASKQAHHRSSSAHRNRLGARKPGAPTRFEEFKKNSRRILGNWLAVYCRSREWRIARFGKFW